MNSLILRTAARVLQPLLLMYSLFLLLVGHNEPGGGFVGGLVGAAGIALYAFAYDARSAALVVRVDPRTLIGAGLFLALASGAAGMVRGRPLMTGQWTDVPAIGGSTLTLGTPLLFDIGVYLVVVGVTLLMILPLSEA